MKTIKLLSLSLALFLLLAGTACQKSAPAAEATTNEDEKSFKPAAEVGVTEYGWMSANSILRDENLLEWFEKSLSRSSVTNAVYYAQDKTTGIWYCWVYTEGYNYGDTVTISVDDTNGTHIRMNATVSNPDADATGAFCFAIPSETEPTFAITVNGMLESLIITLATAPVIP